MRRIRKKHSGLLGSYYLWEKNNKIIRLSTIFQPLISSGRITHGKKLHRHLAEPCNFLSTLLFRTPSATRSRCWSQGHLCTHQLSGKAGLATGESNQAKKKTCKYSDLGLFLEHCPSVRMAAKLLKLCSRTSWPTMIQSMLFLFQGCSN